MTKIIKISNLHLAISAIIVLPMALIYGFQPNLLFDVSINSLDQSNIFKAMMGLYIGFASLWILGIFNQNYWKAASISNMIFMIGLGFGRIVSIIIDGIPCYLFVLGTVGELILGFYAFYQLKFNKK